MASTQISDIVVPTQFAAYALEASLEKNALLKSGLIALNPLLSAKLQAGGGITFNFPSFKNADESSTAANVPSSDASTKATPEKMVARSNIAVRMERNKLWSSADLTATVAGADPLQALIAQVGDAVAKWRTATLMSVLGGVVNTTVLGATGSGGNVNVIAAEATGSVTADTSFSAGALIDTLAVWGDMGVDADAEKPFVVMHPAIKRRLMKADPVSFRPASEANVFFDTYLGFQVITSERYTSRAGTTSGTVYTTYLVKPGAIEMGVGSVETPVEVDRDPAAGNGGGADTLAFRDAFCFHVVGTKYTSPVIAADLPSDAELATAASWNRVFSNKAIGIAALVHN